MKKALYAQKAFNQALMLIDNHIHLADFENEVEKADIVLAKSILESKLPKSYEIFLRKLGAGDFNGREFYGIIPGRVPGTSAPSAVWFTVDERKKHGLPKDMIVVGSTGYRPLYCMDMSELSEDEAPVWIWDKNKIEKVAESFGEFFLKEVESSLSD